MITNFPSLLLALIPCLAPGAPLAESSPVARQEPADAELAAEIDAFVTRLVEQDRFWGVVALALDGEPVFQKAYGYACKRYDVPNRIDTRFNLGSMNKMFTATAICQLQEQGKLSFDDFLIEYVPDYPNAEIAKKVKIHHLLSHTSGMGSFWNRQFADNWHRLRTPSDHLPLFADDPLLFEPGERFAYSNSGFLVLGLVVESVSGQSYFDHVREHVFTPAGMGDTESYELDRPAPNVAMGYVRIEEGEDDRPEIGGVYRNNVLISRVRGGPAGGGYSTAGDLVRFAMAIMEGALLDVETTETMLENKIPGMGRPYAYGFSPRSHSGQPSFGHSGGAPGINAVMKHFPESGYTIVVMANYGSVAPIEELLIRKVTSG